MRDSSRRRGVASERRVHLSARSIRRQLTRQNPPRAIHVLGVREVTRKLLPLLNQRK